MSAAGRVALVTGGATGIGRATCLELARRGVAEIHIGYSRSGQAAEDLAIELRALGAAAYPLHVEVSDRDAVGRAAAHLLETSGGLDVLVNSAGTTTKIDFADLEAVTPELWDDCSASICWARSGSARRSRSRSRNVTARSSTSRRSRRPASSAARCRTA